jgi:predicted transport protein
MKLYKNKGGLLSQIESIPFKLEKEMQNLVEFNIGHLFGYELVKSEMFLKNFRIDSLCFDKNSNSFVIIEYKNTKNYSIIDQGYTYLSLLLNNKSDFILEYNEQKNTNLRRDDIDWTQSKVVFVSPFYTEYQKNSINFKDVPFELWEIKRYTDDTVVLNQHKTDSTESILSTSSFEDNIVTSVNREVKLYSEKFHTEKQKVKEEIREVYNKLKEICLGFGDDIEIRPRKEYIGFIRKTNFLDIEFQSKNLKAFLNLKKGELEDPKGLCRDMKGIGHYGNGEYEIKVDENSDFDYLAYLIKQSYNKQD